MGSPLVRDDAREGAASAAEAFGGERLGGLRRRLGRGGRKGHCGAERQMKCGREAPDVFGAGVAAGGPSAAVQRIRISAQSEPSATTATKTGAQKPMRKRITVSELSGSARAERSSRRVAGQATQAAAIAMPKDESGMPTFEVT